MAHLIDKDALVAEIDRQKIGYNVDGKHSVEYDITRKIIDIINSIEVKEWELEKEIDEYFKGWGDYQGIDSSVTDQVGCCVTLDDIKDACRHFFKLGVKVKQG